MTLRSTESTDSFYEVKIPNVLMNLIVSELLSEVIKYTMKQGLVCIINLHD